MTIPEIFAALTSVRTMAKYTSWPIGNGVSIYRLSEPKTAFERDSEYSKRRAADVRTSSRFSGSVMFEMF